MSQPSDPLPVCETDCFLMADKPELSNPPTEKELDELRRWYGMDTEDSAQFERRKKRWEGYRFSISQVG